MQRGGPAANGAGLETLIRGQMNRHAVSRAVPRGRALVLLLALGLAGAIAGSGAQTSATPLAGVPVAGAPTGGSRAALPPLPPPPDNPVRKFSDLLALDAAGREAILAGKGEWQQRYLRERLAEFDALSDTERAVRLGLLHLRYHLLTLMRTPAAQREARLEDVPEEYRDLIGERLLAWENLPAEQQQELLQNEAVLSQISWFETGSVKRQAAAPNPLFTRAPQELQSDLQRWWQLPESQRARMMRNFSQFFELNDRQRQRTLERVAVPDRARIERAAAALERLPADERMRCLDALNRYAEMSGEERARFLQNAARWQAMSPEQRQAWRWVAVHLAPSQSFLPRPPVPPPPLPRAGAGSRGTPAVTNAQASQ